jgi:hypothetical protein
MNSILGTITRDLDGLGIFLELLFYNRSQGVKDVRTERHKSMVSAFLWGQKPTGAIMMKKRSSPMQEFRRKRLVSLVASEK